METLVIRGMKVLSRKRKNLFENKFNNISDLDFD